MISAGFDLFPRGTRHRCHSFSRRRFQSLSEWEGDVWGSELLLDCQACSWVGWLQTPVYCHLYTSPKKPSHLESMRVQLATVRILWKWAEMALLTEGDEICPKGRKQFRDVIPQAASDNKGGEISTVENLLGWLRLGRSSNSTEIAKFRRTSRFEKSLVRP